MNKYEEALKRIENEDICNVFANSVREYCEDEFAVLEDAIKELERFKFIERALKEGIWAEYDWYDDNDNCHVRYEHLDVLLGCRNDGVEELECYYLRESFKLSEYKIKWWFREDKSE